MSDADGPQQPRSALEELAAAAQQPSHPRRPPAGHSPYRGHYPSRQPEGGYGLAMVGAALGAALGAAIWIGIGWVAEYEIGFVAIAVGALAGWGAVSLGKRQDATVGMIAAVAGLIGILAGSYGVFAVSLRGDEARGEFQKLFEQELASDDEAMAEYSAMSPAEKDALIDEVFEKEVLPNITYFAVLSEDPKSIMFLLLFGGLGLVYGFRVGSGASRSG